MSDKKTKTSPPIKTRQESTDSEEAATSESSGKFEENERKKLLDTFRRFATLKVILAAAFLFFLGGAIVYTTYNRAKTEALFYIFQEIGKGIIVTALVSGAVKWYVTRQTVDFDQQIKNLDEQKEQTFREESKKALSELKDRVTEQTARVAASASSLVALQGAGMIKAFRDRSEAAEDIKITLEKEDANIKLIGISLNDFVRDEEAVLHSVMQNLEHVIKDDNRPSLYIQVLLIDPESNGAFLRANAEGEDVLAKSRLKEDVTFSIDYFQKLEVLCAGKNIRLEARLYRSDPMLYLVWTPAVCFVQQYYFRPRRSSLFNVPIFKCESRRTIRASEFSAHDELNFHFNWIWAHASVPVSEYRKNYAIGVDSAIREANIQNMYYDSKRSEQRILHLVKNTNKVLYIKGVSLHSFFRPGKLFEAFLNACKRGVTVRVLLIDPESEQAKYRSFREYKIMNKDAQLEDFTHEKRQGQRLSADTLASIQFIQNRITRLNLSKIQVRAYRSASEAFLLMTDDTALIEQYHYGTISASEEEATLGGDFPVIEYKNFTAEDESTLFLADRDKEKDPYRILKDHYQFVFEHCSVDIPITLQDTKPVSSAI
jgi:hypothetical protein